MFVKIISVAVLVTSVLSRNFPNGPPTINFKDLNEDDQMLFKAAYDSYETPSYNNANNPSSYDTPYNYNNYDTEIPIGKLDLLKDGMWALKAKLIELKAFDKALAANLLVTKLQVKELLKHSLKPLKTHQHVDVDSKPVHNYQPSSSYTQYEQQHPHYPVAAPAPQYIAPAPQYTAPALQYTAQHYGPQQPVHDPYYGN